MQQEINNSIYNKETEKKFTLLLRFSIYIYIVIYIFFFYYRRQRMNFRHRYLVHWPSRNVTKFGIEQEFWNVFDLKHRYENDRRKKLFLNISLNISLIFDWWVSLRYLVLKKRSFWTFLKKSRIHPSKNFIIYFWNILYC